MPTTPGPAKSADLEQIRRNLFFGLYNYTKNQPDLFIPHRFELLPPFQIPKFFDKVRESMPGEEILIYVHLPFCSSECLFCNAFPLKADRRVQADYLEHLIREIRLFADQGVFAGKKARCIYFGGGTPTLFADRDLGRILDTIAACVPRAERCGITVEAHPTTLAEGKRLAGLAALGVTRISMGCQTFDPEVLALCNRRNSEPLLRKIVGIAREEGLAVNIDMMTGLPGQTLESVRRDIEALERIRPDAVEYIRHEIVNPLAIELFRSRPELVVEKDLLFDMVLMTQEWMERTGYEQNGRFSDGRQWEYRYHWLGEMPIVAFGLRARSYTPGVCFDKYEDLPTYARMIDQKLLPVARYIFLTKRERMYRSLFLGLQVRDGLDIARFTARFGEDPRVVFGPLLDRLRECGCLEVADGHVRLTSHGAYFVEDVCDVITDAVLSEASGNLTRNPHSEGSTSSRLAKEAG
jgi:oxygen-independent coproporphyrinogen-3 oxidase